MIVVIAIGMIAVLIVGISAMIQLNDQGWEVISMLTETPALIPTFEVFPPSNPETVEASATPSATLAPASTPEPDRDTLTTLREEEIPLSDPRDLAVRLSGVKLIPAVVPAKTYQIGDSEKFWVGNMDTNAMRQVGATLQYATDHAYFWMQDGLLYNASDLETLATTFEQNIYPATRKFFGSEWTPGIDDDPHLYILFADNIGAAGYFASSDEYPLAVNPYSNQHEMFVFSSRRLGTRSNYGTLAHEFQHMIHWNVDRNEQAWMNEGFSELSSLINGYDSNGWAIPYLLGPNVQLNDWSPDGSGGTHYGASFMFLAYFWDRFGDAMTQALARDPANGLDAVDRVLDQFDQPDMADDVVIDWGAANILRDPSIENGIYDYSFENFVTDKANVIKTFADCGSIREDRVVMQYGFEYLSFQCAGNVTLDFQGSLTTMLVPANAFAGEKVFWSNKGDDADMTLTREFDLTQTTAPITLTYKTWYDIEKDFDYLYLEASADNGATWTILQTTSGTDDDPLGLSYGWAYTGSSGGWIEESIDLSAYAGQKVLIRFEYVTDGAANGEGFLLDDVSITAADYFSGFESDDGGWIGAGWVRVGTVLPQTFRLALITIGDAGVMVQHLSADDQNRVAIPLTFNHDLREAILVITGTTRYTRQPASYMITSIP